MREDIRVRFVAGGTGDADVHTQTGTVEEQGVGDVVAISDKAEFDTGESFKTLFDGL